jgi:hypothetical protein
VPEDSRAGWRDNRDDHSNHFQRHAVKQRGFHRNRLEMNMRAIGGFIHRKRNAVYRQNL